MGQVIIIEPNETQKTLLLEALSDSGFEGAIFSFKDAKELYSNIKASQNQTNTKKQSDDNSTILKPSDIVLIIADLDSTKEISLPLWKKLTAFIRPVKEDDPGVRLILTTYEESSDNSEAYWSNSSVYTLIHKPFDPLLTKQYIGLALKGDSTVESEELFSSESDTQIEIIKKIDIELLTELGFRTKSSREIPVGKVARYYGPPFEGGLSRSVFAYCYASTPKEDSEGHFSCSFSYFGIANEQLSAIRRTVATSNGKKNYPLTTFPKETQEIDSALLLTRDSQIIASLEDIITSKTEDINLNTIYSLSELFKLLPNGAQQKTEGSKAVGFGVAEPIKIIFNKSLLKIESLFAVSEEGVQPLNGAFGRSLEEIKKADSFLGSYVSEIDRLKLDEIFKNKKIISPTILAFKLNSDSEIHLELISLDETIDSQIGSAYILTLRELSPKESNELVLKRLGVVKNIKLVFIDEKFCSQDSMGSIKEAVLKITEAQKTKPKIILISSQAIVEYKDLERTQIFDDVFTYPFDIFYVSRKLKMHIPQIVYKIEDSNSRLGIEFEKGIQTAMPIDIKSLSEIHLSLFHHRPIDPGQMRTFVLWIPNSLNMPEILAMCKGSKKVETDKYQCNFLFFGVGESQLKYIRHWIRENYVKSKAE